MVPYAAYLRIYEPLSAFGEPERSWWAAYAALAAEPGRMASMAAEHAEALRRVAAVPPVMVPERESEHAYLRRSDGITYVCPWQTRLRSWLALSQLRTTSAQSPVADAFSPAQVEQAAIEFARSAGSAASVRIHIHTATWSIPPTWFVPFAATERLLSIGAEASAYGGTPQAAPAARALLYVTTMSQARRRVGRAIAAVRGALRALPDARAEAAHVAPHTPASLVSPDQAPAQDPVPAYPPPTDTSASAATSASTAPVPANPVAAPAPGTVMPVSGPDGGDAAITAGRPRAAGGPGSGSAGCLVHQALRVEAELAEASRWLAEFHPYSLVELDYGGLVHLVGDEALRSDESAAEVAAAVDGLAERKWEVAVAMYQRVLARWWSRRAMQSAN